jgi:hypothetical protein
MKRRIKRVPYNWLHWKALDLEVEAYRNDKEIYHVDILKKMNEAVVKIHKEGFYGEWWMEVDLDELERIKKKVLEGIQ